MSQCKFVSGFNESFAKPSTCFGMDRFHKIPVFYLWFSLFLWYKLRCWWQHFSLCYLFPLSVKNSALSTGSYCIHSLGHLLGLKGPGSFYSFIMDIMDGLCQLLHLTSSFIKYGLQCLSVLENAVRIISSNDYKTPDSDWKHTCG